MKPHFKLISGFQKGRQSGGEKDDGVAGRRRIPVEPALRVAKNPSQLVLWHNPQTNFVGDKNRRPVERADRRGETKSLRFDLPPRVHKIREPQRQAIGQHNPARARVRLKRFRKRKRRLDRRPRLPTLGPVAGDAGRHFLVPRLGGGDEDAFRRGGLGEVLRVGAFARPGPAKDKDAPRLDHARPGASFKPTRGALRLALRIGENRREKAEKSREKAKIGGEKCENKRKNAGKARKEAPVLSLFKGLLAIGREKTTFNRLVLRSGAEGGAFRRACAERSEGTFQEASKKCSLEHPSRRDAAHRSSG